MLRSTPQLLLVVENDGFVYEIALGGSARPVGLSAIVCHALSTETVRSAVQSNLADKMLYLRD